MTETEKKTEGEAPASSDTQGKKMRWYTLHVYSSMEKLSLIHISEPTRP